MGERKGRGDRLTRGIGATLAGLLVAAGGCGLTVPRWSSPGSLGVQRERAVLHDPYADRGLAPEIVGGRPREFLHPLPQAERSRQLIERSLMQGGPGR